MKQHSRAASGTVGREGEVLTRASEEKKESAVKRAGVRD